MNFSLPDSIVLHDDLQHLHSYLTTALSENQDTDSIVAGSLQLQALIQANQSSYDTSGLAAMETGIKESLNSAPVFDVVFAANPHDTLLSELSRWFRISVHPGSLLKVSVRRSIGGGIVLRSKNRIYDFSLRPKILAAKQKIPEVIKNV